jgi:putative transposase
MELFHALNRGVDQRVIFKDTQDYARFVHNLYEFNDHAPAPAFTRRTASNVGHTMSDSREKLVDIHGWCLMKNHYHLLLSERIDSGMSLFLRKLNVGYARYFNQRHGRAGFLLQGRTKKILVDRHAYFLYILHYIHLNPLDYLQVAKQWRIRDGQQLRDESEVLFYLKSYRWSSFRDYCGTKNFPSLITKKLFAEALGDYENALVGYLRQDMDYLPDSLKLE